MNGRVDCLICGRETNVFHVLPRRALLNKPLRQPEREMVVDLRLGYCEDCAHVSSSYDPPSIDVGARIYEELYARKTPTAFAPSQAAWDDVVARSLVERVAPGADVLEIGCHDGHLLGKLADEGLHVEGVEPSPFAEVAQARGLHVRQEYFSADSFPPRSFDLVVLRHVLEHVERPASLLEGIERVVRADGLVFLELPNSLGSLEELYYPEFHVDHRSYFTPESLARILSGAGLEATSIESVRAYLRFPFLVAFASPGRTRRARDQLDLGAILTAFVAGYDTYTANLQALPGQGRLAVWGSGALGTQYAIDGGWTERDAIYLDPNPATRGLRLSVTGHLVHGLEALDRSVQTVLVASSWEDDVSAQITAEAPSSVQTVLYADLIARPAAQA